MENKVEAFLDKVGNALSTTPVCFKTILMLIKEWGKLLDEYCCNKEDAEVAYKKLFHLKLSLKWFKRFGCVFEDKKELLFIQHLIQYIDVELESLSLSKSRESLENTNKEFSLPNIKWTASKRALIELICSLDAMRCFNDGRVSTKELLVLFEHISGIKLDNYHSEINKMTLRKPPSDKGTKAYFLEELSLIFNKKLSML